MNADREPTALDAVLPCGLAFVASFCLLGVEMAAGRMMAMYVGAGLYNWTSVIGVILAGVTVGNYAGGRLADRIDPRKLLAALLLVGAGVCLAIPILQYWVGRWMRWDAFSETPFPQRVALHVTLVFLLPSTAMGTIGPVVAKLAIDRGGARGRTVGNVYAWGALGSIAGTFAAGFYGIGALGTAGVVLLMAAFLAITAFVAAPRVSLRLALLGAPFLVGALSGSLIVAGRGPGKLVWTDTGLGVRERGFYDRIHSLETEYSFIRVFEDRRKKARNLFMDNLVHAVYSTEKPDALLYDYEQVYDVLSRRIGSGRDGPRSLFIGGGGYVFPRHVRRLWPQGWVEVAEIDAGVTEVNFAAFGLLRDEVVVHELGAAQAEIASAPSSSGASSRPIQIYHLDARNHVEDLLRRKRQGKNFEPFDFVYGDAFNDYCVPYHLVTREFFEKVRDILRPDSGVYLMNVIDIYESGLFLGSLYNTLRQVFPTVYVISTRATGPSMSPTARDTWIIAASVGPIDVRDFGTRAGEPPCTASVLDEAALKHLVDRSHGLVLTDDYTPVENLLEVVVQRRSMPSVESSKASDSMPSVEASKDSVPSVESSKDAESKPAAE